MYTLFCLKNKRCNYTILTYNIIMIDCFDGDYRFLSNMYPLPQKIKVVHGEFLPPCPSDWYVMRRKSGVYAVKYEPLVGFGIFRKRSTAWGRDIKPEDVPERIKGLLGDVEEEWYSLSFEDSKWIKNFFDDQLRNLLKREFEVEDRPVR